MLRRFGDTPKQGLTWKRRAGVYAIIHRNGHILLTHETSPSAGFQLPGGGIEPGEHTLQALYREVLEETGWRIATPKRLGTFTRFILKDPLGHNLQKICTIYTARAVRQAHAPTEPGHAAVWTTPDQALHLLKNAGDRAFLQRFTKSLPDGK